MITPEAEWKPARVDVVEKNTKEGVKSQENQGFVEFDAGCLTTEEINAMLNTLPIDITFVDKNDTVKYFTQGKERIFARPKTIIGRKGTKLPSSGQCTHCGKRL